MTEYKTIKVTRADGVGTIQITPTGRHGRGGASSAHSEIGAALQQLRFDNEIRVVVIRIKTVCTAVFDNIPFLN